MIVLSGSADGDTLKVNPYLDQAACDAAAKKAYEEVKPPSKIVTYCIDLKTAKQQ